jgi:hypothetical protein
MRAEQASIQSNTSYLLRDEACVLPGCHAPLAAALAAEQEMAWPSACNANVVVDCLPRLLCHFEANRLSRFLLSDRCPINGGSMGGNVFDLERDDIATAQLAVDGQIEHCQIARLSCTLKPGAYQPDVLRLERLLCSDYFAFIPRRVSREVRDGILMVVLHGHAPWLVSDDQRA